MGHGEQVEMGGGVTWHGTRESSSQERAQAGCVEAPSCLWSVGLSPAASGESQLIAYAGMWDAHIH